MAHKLVEMGKELTKIDGTLDDSLFAPFRQVFYNQAGEPAVLVSTCLRMMAKAHHSQSFKFASGLLYQIQSRPRWGKHHRDPGLWSPLGDI